MATLNITYQGRSGSVTVGNTVTPTDIKRIAVEVVRTGELPDLHDPDMLGSAFDSFVVDSFYGGGETIFYLRPKVPFGGQ